MSESSLLKACRLIVFIPAFNEEKTIGDVIRRIPRDVKGADKVIVLVLDDGSTDNTFCKAYDAGADFVIKHHYNMGVGRAFKDGIKNALELGADVIVNLDADGQHNPDEIPKLINPILEGTCDVVIGSRYLNGNKVHMSRIKNFGNRFFTKLMCWITGVQLTDSQSGFRAFSREGALHLNGLGKFTYTHESLIELAMKGVSIIEVEIKVDSRQNGKSRVVKSWYSYGFKALPILLRSLRDFKPLAFFGSLSLVSLLAGCSSGIFLLIHWLLTGRTSPYTSIINFAVLAILSGLFLLVLALMADMQGRQRRVQEEMLYYLKRLNYDKREIKYEENEDKIIKESIRRLS